MVVSSKHTIEQDAHGDIEVSSHNDRDNTSIEVSAQDTVDLTGVLDTLESVDLRSISHGMHTLEDDRAAANTIQDGLYDTLEDTLKREDTLDEQPAFSLDDQVISGLFADLSEYEISRLLIVDDEPYVLRAIKRLFRDEDIEVLTAPSGSVALDVLANTEISVIISDQFMPGMSGTEFLKVAQVDHPEAVRIMLTGNNDLDTAVEAINQGDVFRFITKPWKNEELLRLVRLGMEQNRYLINNRRYQNLIKSQNEHLRVLNEELERRVNERTSALRKSREKISDLYKDLQESFDATLSIMLSIMELGDIHIVDHCQRTAALVQGFGEHLQLSPREIKPIVRAGLLHWIGLISAPATMISKSIHEFDFEEQAAWEFHPLLAHQALGSISALQKAGDIILNYLNRYDSRDFVQGLTQDGMSTPLDAEMIRACRILYMCSTFEHERTILKRRGEKRLSTQIERGIFEINRGRGSLFEPRLVTRFVEFVQERFIQQRVESTVVSASELRVGMVLSRPIESQQGLPVAPRELKLSREVIERLKVFEQTGGLGTIYIWS